MNIAELKEHYETYHPKCGFNYEIWNTNSNNSDNW